jgi:hypothetical protein
MTRVPKAAAAAVTALAAKLRLSCRRQQTLYLTAVLFLTGVGLLTSRHHNPAFESIIVKADLNFKEATTTLSSLDDEAQLPPDEEGTCWCHRRHRSLQTAPELKQTSCGLSAFARGPGQKVIGFTYYEVVNSSMETEREYFRGITDNLDLIK